MSLSVLLTNGTLRHRAGSELYLRDVAIALLRRGHKPIAFSTVLGPVADDLRAATVPVVDDLDRLVSPPDVIHGQHHVETLIAALRFPGTPIVNFCHGWLPWEEQPLHHPAVRRYIAVDDVCRDRLVREEGIRETDVEVLLNFVDLDRFARREPLPVRPLRALVFSNQAIATTYPRAIRAACDARGIALDIAGSRSGSPVVDPAVLLPQYDVVFAKARAALEAMAIGCSVVLADAAGAGPLVTPGNLAALRRQNFGVRTLTGPHSAAHYGAALDAIDPAAAAAVSAVVRADAGLDPAIDRLEGIYREAMASPPRECDDRGAAARHLAKLAPVLKLLDDLRRETEVAVKAAEVMGEQVADLDRLRRSRAVRMAGIVKSLLGGRGPS
jgi:hypothetical protein